MGLGAQKNQREKGENISPGDPFSHTVNTQVTAYVAANAAPDVAFTPLPLPCVSPSLRKVLDVCEYD